MRFAKFIPLILMLTACASFQRLMNKDGLSTAERHELVMKERAVERERLAHLYDGWTEEKVVRELGAPSKIEEVGGFKILYYRRDYGASTHGAGFVPYGGYGLGLTSATTEFNYNQTTIFLKNGIVDHWRTESN